MGIKNFFMAFVALAMGSTVFAANPFSDVPASHWAAESVAAMVSKGVITGYGDGRFRGERNITRYEAAAMIAKLRGGKFKIFDSEQIFRDVPKSHWAYEFVQAAAESGINKGYDDKTFRGDRYITRYEMAQMLANAVKSSAGSATGVFNDIPANHWALAAVNLLAAKGIINGYGDQTFRGEKNITRYEAAVMIAKLSASG